jgi:hypothetical protein
MQWAPGCFLGDKTAGLSPPSSAEVKDECSYTVVFHMPLWRGKRELYELFDI